MLTRLFGEDGARQTGFRLGWLLPVDWYAELHYGAQNATGETMVSFLANDEVFEERPIAGRPFVEREVKSLNDLAHLFRFVTGFDLGETWSAQLGASALLGPNATGPGGRTRIYGADAVAKWRPVRSDQGWPFLTVEAEWLERDYRADANLDDPNNPFPSKTFDDRGGYVQGLWGFRKRLAAGMRAEYASSSGASFPDGRDDDPFRGDRLRLSPLLLFQQSEFARWRLQYNYDRAEFLAEDDSHSVWLVLELGIGPHAAHRY
jgi:hypothetical protein